MHVKANTQ